jgi:hypothetical protein
MTDDFASDSQVRVTLRIPGPWTSPETFMFRLPQGCRIEGETLTLPSGLEFEISVLEADDEFPSVFASSCNKVPSKDEQRRIENYRVNVCITRLGGSLEAARQLMQGASAIIAAGGAGVFIDNCGLAHGATDWKALHDSLDRGGIYWAFVTTARTDSELWSVGMQILGFRDAVIPFCGDQDFTFRTLHSFLGYTAFSGKVVADGEIVTDPVLPTIRAIQVPYDRFPAGSPVYNPFGQWRLVPVDTQVN